jgi:hypothetical protein
MKIRKKFPSMVLAAAVVLTAAAYPAAAANQERTMLQEQEKLMAQVMQDTGMSAGEVEGLQMQLQNALRAAGEGSPVRSMVRTAYREGCHGECLGTALDGMAKAMKQNYSAGEAQSMIRKEIRTCVRERAETGISEAEMAVRLRTRLEERILARVRADQEASEGGSGTANKGVSVSGRVKFGGKK